MEKAERIQDNNYHSSCDVFPTIFPLAGLVPSRLHDGTDMMKFKKTSWSYFANLGAGTPDIYREKITYGVRNKSFLVVIRASIHETLKDENVIAIYDKKVSL